MTASPAIPRAGRLDCLCEPGALGGGATDRGGIALLAIGFVLSVLSQVLSLSISPDPATSGGTRPGLRT